MSGVTGIRGRRGEEEVWTRRSFCNCEDPVVAFVVGDISDDKGVFLVGVDAFDTRRLGRMRGVFRHKDLTGPCDGLAVR
jgi:hypothetical protein